MEFMIGRMGRTDGIPSVHPFHEGGGWRERSGCPGRIRTFNPQIQSLMRCQLRHRAGSDDAYSIAEMAGRVNERRGEVTSDAAGEVGADAAGRQGETFPAAACQISVRACAGRAVTYLLLLPGTTSWMNSSMTTRPHQTCRVMRPSFIRPISVGRLSGTFSLDDADDHRWEHLTPGRGRDTLLQRRMIYRRQSGNARQPSVAAHRSPQVS